MLVLLKLFFRAEDEEEVENLLEQAQLPKSSKTKELFLNFYVLFWKIKNLQSIESGENEDQMVSFEYSLYFQF
jgi:hypothetical protein